MREVQRSKRTNGTNVFAPKKPNKSKTATSDPGGEKKSISNVSLIDRCYDKIVLYINTQTLNQKKPSHK